MTARTLAATAPGASVEVRVPPFVAVQCISGPRHTRGNPPNVVETDPRTWLLLAAGLRTVADAAAGGRSCSCPAPAPAEIATLAAGGAAGALTGRRGDACRELNRASGR